MASSNLPSTWIAQPHASCLAQSGLGLEPASARRFPRSSKSLDCRERFSLPWRGCCAQQQFLHQARQCEIGVPSPFHESTCCQVCSSSIFAFQVKKFFLLPLKPLSKLRVNSLKSVKQLPCQFKVSLNLPLSFSTSPLVFFSRSSIFTLIQRIAQASLNLVHVFCTCPPWIGYPPRSFWQFSPVDFFSLVSFAMRSSWWSNLITQSDDLAVLGHLVFLTLLNGTFKILNLLSCSLVASAVTFLHTRLSNASNSFLLSSDPCIGGVNLLLDVVLVLPPGDGLSIIS